MSAELSIVFYGVCFEVNRDAIEELETRTHQLVIAAKRTGLDHYWIDPGEAEQSLKVLVGKKLGLVGAEHQSVLQIDFDELLMISRNVRDKLEKAKLTGTPLLSIMWYPDND